MKILKEIILVTGLFVLTSCGGGDKGEETPDPISTATQTQTTVDKTFKIKLESINISQTNGDSISVETTGIESKEMNLSE